MSRRNSNTRWTSAIGAALLVGALLLSASLTALPAGGLALQATDLTTTPAAQAIELAEQRTPGPQTTPQPPTTPVAGSSPVLFIENAGQWDPGARFQVWGGPAGTVWLAQDAIWIVVASGTSHPADGRRPAISSEALADLPTDLQPTDLQPATLHAIKLSFVGANPQPHIEAFDPQETVVSYFLGNAPDQWRPAVPVWGGARYVDLYPGIDLELSSEQGQMTPRLAARPDADLGAVRLRVEGADAVSVDGEALRLSTDAGEIVWPLLSVDRIQVTGLQVEASALHAFDIAAPFVPANRQPTVTGEYQRSPADNPAELLYSTFLGGDGSDTGSAISVDRAGSAYVVGTTSSRGFPTTPGAFDTGYNGNESDAFVAKFNPTGSRLTYATFLGGNHEDQGLGIAVDVTGNAYVTGETVSSNFPITPGAFDTGYNSRDAFVAKLNPAGSGLAYATFLGGSGVDDGQAIAVDESGRAYVAGETYSSDFPTTIGAFDTSYNGGNGDVFIAKLNSAGSGLDYSTFLGGDATSGYNEGDRPSGIVVDAAGSAYVIGTTDTSNFPTTPQAFDTSYNGGLYGDAFVAKLNPAGSRLTYATFLGGTAIDFGIGIAVDGTGNAYLVGETTSHNFPSTPGAFDTSFDGDYFHSDAFLVKLNPSGSELIYATFLGGSGGDQDSGYAIAVDGMGSAYVTGLTRSSTFPTTPNAFDTSHNGEYDAFVVKLHSSGSRLTYATFLGSSDTDSGYAIAVDEVGAAYVVAYTQYGDFPTTSGAFDTSYNGGSSDACAIKLAMVTPPDIHLPLVLYHWSVVPNAPVLNTITPPNANQSYTVRWSAANGAVSYVLQRATNTSFADATQIYAGSGTSTTVTSEGIARYYYRVQARNQYGSSSWSNVQWVDVRWEQEPNYPLTNANGPLLSGLNYYGFPNDTDDYFYFQVASRGQVAIDLTNHSDQSVQLLLRTPTGDLVAQVVQPPYHLVTTVEPGRYYLQLYATGNFNTNAPYTLRAVFP